MTPLLLLFLFTAFGQPDKPPKQIPALPNLPTSKTWPLKRDPRPQTPKSSTWPRTQKPTTEPDKRGSLKRYEVQEFPPRPLTPPPAGAEGGEEQPSTSTTSPAGAEGGEQQQPLSLFEGKVGQILKEFQSTEETYVLSLMELEEKMEERLDLFEQEIIGLLKIIFEKHNGFLKKLIHANTHTSVRLVYIALNELIDLMENKELRKAYVTFIVKVSKWVKLLDKLNPKPRKNKLLSEIGALIITPMQRLPRYELLLKDLLKTPVFKDNQNAKRALDACVKTAKHINKRV
ncbi:hypothetical protein EIN_281780 [Entamoeba invadens IP1]|uniref:DH domain-containing protein n=1 Tax=Entamoeba invadens IP1 TaxID=370355 RepID=A0A0A1TX31_ENTIV|nr:hypothetical protein EIN_281780 [Entamoeba invadens IP1]ELP85807.1 hypothetical protein EIN_281780 [Entamoeba invadens IP1]|eukprot:XP_004185153.1 hypothetical protein EIN_281780 [Entamoeba invadens IP1]